MSDPADPLKPLSEEVRASWQAFLDVFEHLRPELYRYCRHLTHTPWEAEDLVQDVLMRGFVTLGTMFSELPNPRAWLFRVASNLWIDRVRRSRFELGTAAPGETAAETPGDGHVGHQGMREAGGTLLVRLSPQERAAVVLKDVFDFSIDDIAEVLSTTPGATKAALHRGRQKLVAAPRTAPDRAPAPGALDAFCAAFNARDLQGLTNLLLESATVEIVGVVTEYGREAPRDKDTGSLANTLAPLTNDERGGVDPELLDGYLGRPPRAEVRPYRDGFVLLFWYDHHHGPAVRGLMRVEVAGDAIAWATNYFFSPDVIAEVCTELAVPYRVNGYRYWHRSREPGASLGKR